MSTGEGRIIEVNGVPLYVEDHGSGTPVRLIHGWPDSCYLWRHQIRFLTGHGFRVIAPDLRGLGRSGRPAAVADYALANAVGDMAGLVDALGVASAHLVGHDWGAAVGWFTAMLQPNRVNKLVVLSVGHPRAPRTLRQAKWPGTSCSSSSKASPRPRSLRRLGLAAPVQPRRRRPGTLPARLVPPRRAHRLTELVPGEPGPPDARAAARNSLQCGPPPSASGPTNDHYLDGERMEKSGAYVQAWRYEVIEGASHWIPRTTQDTRIWDHNRAEPTRAGTRTD